MVGVSFEEKNEELFAMVNIPVWFAVDTRLGSLFVHLDTPQLFSAEMYSADLNIIGKPEDDKINLAHETLKGLLAHCLTKRRQRFGYQASAIGEKLFHMNVINYIVENMVLDKPLDNMDIDGTFAPGLPIG
ncbi:hypothetical protein ACSBR1_041892 [Camellia fascicularis]